MMCIWISHPQMQKFQFLTQTSKICQILLEKRLSKNQDSALHGSLISFKKPKPNKQISERKFQQQKNQKNLKIRLSERGKMAILGLFWQINKQYISVIMTFYVYAKSYYNVINRL